MRNGNAKIDGVVTGSAVSTTGEANKLIKVSSTGRVVLGGTDDTSNKLQVEGSIRLGTGLLSKTEHSNDGIKKVLGSWTALTTSLSFSAA